MKKRKILKLQKTKLRGKCKIEETAKKREIWKLQKIIKKKVVKCEENQKILKPQKTQNYGENYKIGEKWGKCKIWEKPEKSENSGNEKNC